MFVWLYELPAWQGEGRMPFALSKLCSLVSTSIYACLYSFLDSLGLAGKGKDAFEQGFGSLAFAWYLHLLYACL
jgi:hypothetical protein